MAIAKYNNKRDPKLCGQNCEYITRLNKTDSINFYNLDSLDVGDLAERRAAAIAYGETRELEAANNKRIKNGSKRQDRNHNTLILSWDRTETAEKVNEMTNQFLEENFKNARCIYTVHNDKPGQTHAHIFIDNRLENGKALQIKPADFYTLDEKWAKKFDKEYSTEYAAVFKQRKDETFAWKKRKATAGEGVAFTEEKPLRYGDLIKEKVKENRLTREYENAGVVTYDKATASDTKRFVTAGRSAIAAAEFAIVDSDSTINNSAGEFDRTLQYVKEQIIDLDQKQIERQETLNRNLTR